MDFKIARKNMVENQIRANKVTSLNVINAFLDVPREKFVPDALQEISYVDEDIQLSRNRFMMKPMILARLFQSLNLKGNENILHVGSNSGYGSAILSRMCSSVISLESDKKLFETSIHTFSNMGFDNVVPLHGSMENGVEKEAPFDIIFIEGSIETEPKSLFGQLNENGKLIAIIRPANIKIGKAKLFFKISNEIGLENLFDAQVSKLSIFKSKTKFSF
ncbi:MAG: protein-L-isoaspartate O-methyltransferase [Alphaproteobacteria bacterium]|mgnify:FL=1|jgi:protein-L-isoaspartate(D-aspartate) O-methyltransferase|nr:MAG: protein-L-isoaspartate O-methyltransferase [Alphaproteobacteria bacterium]|tara:strand:- start:302 stop:958 length:657 start_codon:yes stop_codon:yes gene_type:complete